MRQIAAYSAILLFAAGCGYRGASADVASLSGERAMEHVRAQVAIGPRPPGSEALERCRQYLEQQLRGWGYQIERDAFEAVTPYGPKKMVNLIARKGAGNRDAIALASHYDSKYMEGKNFVGANDGGASTGLLLELARVLADSRKPLDYWFVFLDGEEAFIEWSTFDSTYGSRHLARRWKQEGVVPRVKALVLLDMIGDRDLDILQETNSTPWLMGLVLDVARRNGFSDILSRYSAAIEDDHLPFLDVGIPSVDIIDLNYGPGNSFHHTLSDTLDKVSPVSLEKTGKLTLLVLDELQKKLGGK
jgi:Zn-dependent M28 family amino/carboxypeptidase